MASTTAWDSGGYSLELAAGVYDVVFSGQGLFQMASGVDLTGGVNVKVDAVNLQPKPGDANGDGRVTFVDFSILQNHFNMAGTFSDGDFNGDGMVTFADFSILQNNFEQSGGPPSLVANLAEFGAAANQVLPEPGSFSLVALGAVLAVTKRRSGARGSAG